MKKEKNSWFYRFKTYLLKRYLKKELENRMRKLEEEIKKLNPISLLAIKNGLSLKSTIPSLSTSEYFCFPEIKIYEDFLENKYVPTNLGFDPIEKYNAQVELMEIHIKYSNLLNDFGKLEGKFEKENELLENAQLKTSELNTLLGNLRNRVKILEKEVFNINWVKKENKKLQYSLLGLKNKLVALTIKNTHATTNQSDKLGCKGRTAMKKIISSTELAPTQKLELIEKLL